MKSRVSSSGSSGSIGKGIAAGVLGGLVASYAMNQFQSVWSSAAKAFSAGQEEPQESESEEEPATVKAAKAISTGIFQHELTDSEKKWAAPAVHYAFGAALGALYGFITETVPVSSSCRGITYGAAVWMGADEIGVPAAGLSPPPMETPVSSHVSALASHLVYGLTTDLVRRAILSQ
jgi:putative membrane protein